MISEQPTQNDLQKLWLQDPLVFHTVPMPGFHEQEISAAQWALLLHPTDAFWKDKSMPQDPSLWSWAIANTSAATLAFMANAKHSVPVDADSLVLLLLRSAKTKDKLPFSLFAHAAAHPQAWCTEKDKIQAPEILLAANNQKYLDLLVHRPDILQWQKPSTGNTLLHTAVLNESRHTISWLLKHGASQSANNNGVTPQEMALSNKMGWPSSFGLPSAPKIDAPTRARPKVIATAQFDLF